MSFCFLSTLMAHVQVYEFRPSCIYLRLFFRTMQEADDMCYFSSGNGGENKNLETTRSVSSRHVVFMLSNTISGTIILIVGVVWK